MRLVLRDIYWMKSQNNAKNRNEIVIKMNILISTLIIVSHAANTVKVAMDLFIQIAGHARRISLFLTNRSV